MTWWKKTWSWVKENWKSVLLGISTLGIGLLIGRAARRPQEVVNPELTEAEIEKKRAREEQERKDREAKERRDMALQKVQEEYADRLKELTEEQSKRVAELSDDPEELNDYLLEISKDVRGG